ncbi:hypothetical protein L6452_32490 [Arctium lappa]|uniref:Uncharacterized protein n=1 Tax=Arctium lappa TaxID=4217 RepID=A0ACB8Z3U9_ARCLA|nr:hypothetical protein L6452_32490 [Arctium lappa]
MVILAKEYTLVLRLGLDLTLKRGLCDSYLRTPNGLAHNTDLWSTLCYTTILGKMVLLSSFHEFHLAVGCTGFLRVERGLEAYFEMSSILVLGIV